MKDDDRKAPASKRWADKLRATGVLVPEILNDAARRQLLDSTAGSPQQQLAVLVVYHAVADERCGDLQLGQHDPQQQQAAQ